ncbi:hypothetical protein GCM10009638_12480 [Luteococcus sanguinis]
MDDRWNQLTVAPCQLLMPGGSPDSAPDHQYLGFVVDGRNFTDLFPETGDMVSPFTLAWPIPVITDRLDTLLGRVPDRDVGPGRVVLMSCAECGDLACGALTARLSVRPTEVMWSDFAWESGDGDADYYDSSPELIFDRRGYERELTAAARLLAAAPVVDH